MTGVFIKERSRRFGCVDTENRGSEVAEAEIGVMRLQAKGSQGFLAAPRRWERQGGILP